MNLGTQHKLTRVRPPRVKITLDVETEGSEEKKELPFVLAVMGDFSGDNLETNSIDNDFVDVDNENLNYFMRRISPKLSYTADNERIELKFQSREDFEIYNVILQIPHLKERYDNIHSMEIIIAYLDGREKGINLLLDILKDNEKIKTLIDEIEEDLKKEEGGEEVNEEKKPS